MYARVYPPTQSQVLLMMSEYSVSPADAVYPPLDHNDWDNIRRRIVANDVAAIREIVKSHGGADVCFKQAQIGNMTILNSAAGQEKPDIIAALLDMKADPNFKLPPVGDEAADTRPSAFQMYISKSAQESGLSENSTEIVKLFARHGANLRDTLRMSSHEACTTLMVMMIACNDDVCATILEAFVGTSIDPLTKQNADDVKLARIHIQGAFVQSIRTSYVKSCDILVSKFGADPIMNIEDKYCTPLMLATQTPGGRPGPRGDPYRIAEIISGPICSILVNAGAYPLVMMTEADKTPYWVISKLHHTMYPGIADAFNAMHDHIRFRMQVRFLRILHGRKKTESDQFFDLVPAETFQLIQFFDIVPAETFQLILLHCLPKTSTIHKGNFAKYIAEV